MALPAKEKLAKERGILDAASGGGDKTKAGIYGPKLGPMTE